MPAPDELCRIYDGDYFRDDPLRPDREGYADYLADEALHRRNARRRLNMLSAYRSGPGMRLLDVGCAAGFFVEEASARGWRAEGIDLAQQMVEWGRLHLECDLTISPFSDFSGEPSTLDAVTMWDYVEHSIDPGGDATHAHALLKPGGLIALSTGDVESTVARLSGKRWHLLTPRHHNYFFGRSTLGKMLEQTGFEVLRTVHESCWYSLAHLVYKLETLLLGGVGRSAAQRLRRSRAGAVAIPVNLYDIITVVARKRASAS